MAWIHTAAASALALALSSALGCATMIEPTQLTANPAAALSTEQTVQKQAVSAPGITGEAQAGLPGAPALSTDSSGATGPNTGQPMKAEPKELTSAGEPPAPTPGSFSPFMNPKVGLAPYRADYRVTWFGSEPVAGQGTRLGYVQQDFGFSLPIWQNRSDEWSAAVHVRNEDFYTCAILPDTNQPFPEDLWNIRFSTTYRHEFDNGWITGGTVSVGSASDKPFHSINEMTAGINTFLRIPQGEHNAWLFSLSYSPTSELAFPIPGVAYIYQPSENFRVNLGLPFQLMYRPIDDLTLDFSYMLLRSVHARATYRLCDMVRVYGGFDWQNESYFLADRANENDRLFYYDKRLTTGVQFKFNRHFSLDVSGGYVFDRFYFEGASYSDNHQNRVDVGDGPFLSLQGQLRW